MKLIFLSVETKSPSWLTETKEIYFKKLNAFYKTDEIQIKSPDLARGDREQKIQKEAEKILKALRPRDLVVLWDEKGEELNSIRFAQKLQNKIEQSPERIVFVVGGAFGVSEEIQKRSQWKVCLSPFTLNHWVAQVVALEQVYRANCILKNLPYHNE